MDGIFSFGNISTSSSIVKSESLQQNEGINELLQFFDLRITWLETEVVRLSNIINENRSSMNINTVSPTKSTETNITEATTPEEKSSSHSKQSSEHIYRYSKAKLIDIKQKKISIESYEAKKLLERHKREMQKKTSYVQNSKCNASPMHQQNPQTKVKSLYVIDDEEISLKLPKGNRIISREMKKKNSHH